jgi:hypothetical protein
VALLLVALTSCSQPQAIGSNVGAVDAKVMASDASTPQTDAVVDAAAPVQGEPPEPNQTPATPTTSTPLMLAYAYTASIALPQDKVLSTMAMHRRKCEQAGPSLCQIVGASSDRQGDDAVNARLNLRATPNWLATFRSGLEQDAKAANGRIDAQGVTSEDLTRSITDSQARLSAMKALRTRIEALIASRPGKLSDLLEAERELARVQSEIESYESNLSVMRARVSMSTMELAYTSKLSAVRGGAFAPVTEAVTNFLSVMAGSLGFLIGLFAAVIPFLVVGAPLLYYGNKWRLKRKAAKSTS